MYYIIRIQISEDKTLHIRNVSPSDEGIYICEASNQVGIASASSRLTINCKQFIKMINILPYTSTQSYDYYQKSEYNFFYTIFQTGIASNSYAIKTGKDEEKKNTHTNNCM